MASIRTRNLKVALLTLGSAILLFSCAEREAAPDRPADEAVMTEYSERLSVVVSQNGRRSYRFEAPLLEGYTLGGEPYREFRRGVEVFTYLDDSLSTVDATLRANYAIFYPDRQLWEARGDVAVEKHDGKRLYTQQLFWNARTRKIYSNVDSKFVHPRGVSYGEGFEADEDFKDWRFRRQRSRLEVEAPRRDSTAARNAADRRSDRGRDGAGRGADADADADAAGSDKLPAPRSGLRRLPDDAARPLRPLRPERLGATPERSDATPERRSPTERLSTDGESRPAEPAEADGGRTASGGRFGADAATGADAHSRAGGRTASDGRTAFGGRFAPGGPAGPVGRRSSDLVSRRDAAVPCVTPVALAAPAIHAASAVRVAAAPTAPVPGSPAVAATPAIPADRCCPAVAATFAAADIPAASVALAATTAAAAGPAIPAVTLATSAGPAAPARSAARAARRTPLEIMTQPFAERC